MQIEEMIENKDEKIRELETHNANMSLAIDNAKIALALGTTFRERKAFEYLNKIKDSPYYAKFIYDVFSKDNQITQLQAENEKYKEVVDDLWIHHWQDGDNVIIPDCEFYPAMERVGYKIK